MADMFEVRRQARLDADQGTIRSLIEDFRRWPSWSPWEELDPNVAHEYGGSERGKGAWTTWRGNRKAGEGRMEITDTDEDSVTIDLRFVKPFKSNNTTTFTLRPDGNATDVTWTMVGPKTLMTKVMGIFWPMDKMIGKDFEKGLAKLSSASKRDESSGP